VKGLRNRGGVTCSFGEWVVLEAGSGKGMDGSASNGGGMFRLREGKPGSLKGGKVKVVLDKRRLCR